jgi:hypothetical protein
VVLLDGNGKVVGRSEGLGTNHWVGKNKLNNLQWLWLNGIMAR